MPSDAHPVILISDCPEQCVDFTCRICGNTKQNVAHRTQDLWGGSTLVYLYVECGACGCVQIADYPADVKTIYPPSYYAHGALKVSTANPFRNWLRKQWIGYGLSGKNPLGWALALVKPLPQWYVIIGKLGVRRTSAVLDVGCGTGTFLLWLGRAGFKQMTGIDPYIPEERTLPSGAGLFRRSVFEETGVYDFITLIQVFEHMQTPGRILGRLCNLLSDDGVVMLSLPVLGNAWRQYGTYWWGFEAPRHFYLHTRRSLEVLCEKAGFEIAEALYTSSHWQFVGSELCKRGFTRQDVEREDFPVSEFYDAEQIASLEQRADHLNRSHDGDQAIFFLKKKGCSVRTDSSPRWSCAKQ